MADIKSHNNNSKDELKSLLIPSLAELFFYIFISIFLLALIKVGDIWGWLKDTLATEAMSIQSVNSHSSFHNAWQTISDSRLPQIIFWLLVGVIIYSLIWFLLNISNNVRNDIVANDYVHPRSFDRRHYWQKLIFRKVFFAMSILVLIIYMIVFVKTFSLMGDLCESFIQDFEAANSLSVLISCPLAGALLVYILRILGQICLNAWRTISTDL